MKIKELLSYLKDKDPEMELVIDGRTIKIGHVQSSEIKIRDGYMVAHPDDDKTGYFVMKTMAHSICENGKEFLDLSSPHIFPALYFTF